MRDLRADWRRWTRGERVAAVVQAHAGRTLNVEELIHFVKGRIGSVKAPKQVDIWPDLPRSKVGKVLKKEIRATILSREKGADLGGDAERERDLKRR